ncbi:MAG: M48 family metalloprotease [Planctomycetia bacterium]|nr:M48 family metalloprotease [Planctomycetia bacterium]
MTFFEQEAKSRKLSRRMTLMFLLSALITVLLWHACIAAICLAAADGDTFGQAYLQVLLNPELLGIDVAVLGGLIFLSYLFKSGELKKLGPEGIAASLSGTCISRSTEDLYERRLYNVVEEVAIAAGIQTPRVYMMKGEKSINACAIGHSVEDAVVCVTAGAVERLTRDELQGVVAHEIGHIVNSDIILNYRLIGVLFGIQVITIVALTIMRMGISGLSNRTYRSKSDSKAALAILAIVVVTAVLCAIGWLGSFAGNLISLAISRQREYLADASSVRLTRNPRGLAGALMKIGCPSVGSAIQAPKSVETAHMFFSSVFSSSFLTELQQTHPPLLKRILAIYPSFQGEFPQYVDLLREEELREEDASARSARIAALTGRSDATFSDQDQGDVHVDQPTNADIDHDYVEPEAGIHKPILPDKTTPVRDQVEPEESTPPRLAGQLGGALPATLDSFLTTKESARAVIYALVWDRRSEISRRMHMILTSHDTPEVLRIFPTALKHVGSLTKNLKLTAARCASPLLKSMTREEYQRFRQALIALCQTDARLDLFEYTLQVSVLRDLDVYYRVSRPISVRYRHFHDVAPEVNIVLSTVAHCGELYYGDAHGAYDAAWSKLPGDATLLPKAQCQLNSFSVALNKLAYVSSELKEKILDACRTCVVYDDYVTEEEDALLSAIHASLGVPAPVWK